MERFSSYWTGRRPIAADKVVATDSQPEPIQDSTEPKKTLKQATRRTRPTSRTAAGSVKSVDTAHDDMVSDDDLTSDHANEGKEIYASEQAPVHQPSKHSRDFPHRRTSARITGRPEAVEKTPIGNPIGNPIGTYPSLRTHDQESLSPRTLRRPERPEQANIREQEPSRWDELPGKIDGLSADMRSVLSAMRELQQDKHEKVALQKDLKEAQDKQQETTAALEKVQKSWKKAASQLDQVRSQGMGQYQLSDSDLTASVKRLRYDIRAFSVQYFAVNAPRQSGDVPTGNFWRYMYETTPGSDDYQAHLASETRGPIVIEAFLWRLLVGEIFGKFCWVPWLQESITRVYQALQPDVYYDEFDREIPRTPEAERRFQMWKATTSALILEHIKDVDEEKVEKRVENFNSKISDQVLDVIRSFVRELDGAVLNDLRHIIESSIALDQEICRQAARVDWIYPPSGGQVPFDPDCMSVEMGEVASQPGQYVGVVIAPALKKRGKSTGENFETEYFLLKMNVTCVPLSPGSCSTGRVAR